MSVNQRILSNRLRAGLSQTQLAEAVGVTRAAVQQWERHGGTAPRRALQPKVARTLGLSVASLMSGEDVVDAQRHVPLLSEAEVYRIPEEDALTLPAETPVVLTNVKVSNDTFAVTIHGDSMVDQHEAFPDGSVLIVDRSLLAQAGDYVVVQDGPDRILFRQLVKVDGEYLLKPLNPTYQTRPLGTGEVIGVVREFTKRIR